MKTQFGMVFFLTTMVMFSSSSSARYGCNISSEILVEPDTALPLDFTARTLLDRLQGVHDSVVYWENGKQEKARVKIEYRGGLMRYVEQYFDDAGTGQEIAPPCYNQLEVEVVIHLELVDSGRHEEFVTTLKAPALEMISQQLEIDPTVAAHSILVSPEDRARLKGDAARLVFTSNMQGDDFHNELAILYSEDSPSQSFDASTQQIKARLAHWVIYGL